MLRRILDSQTHVAETRLPLHRMNQIWPPPILGGQDSFFHMHYFRKFDDNQNLPKFKVNEAAKKALDGKLDTVSA